MTPRRQFLTSSAVGLAGLMTATTFAQQQPTTLTSLYVSNMHCEGCAKRLRTKLYKLPNVLKVTTNVKSGTAIITPSSGKEVSSKSVWTTAENEKFKIVKLADKNGVHTKKPTI